MNAYPIGNDLTVKWSLLYSDGSVFPLSNYDYELSYRTNRGNKVVTDTSVISVDENILTWTFKGNEQVVSGRYTICLKITLSGSKVVELQYDNAFMLSPLSGFKGAGSEIVLQSYCDAIDLKEAVLQARKAMDLAANAVVDTANSARDAKAAKAAAEVTAAQAKADAESAKTMAADAKDKVAVAEKAATDASRDAVAAQQAAQTASDHITSLQQAISELPDGQAVTEKVAEHTIKLTELERKTYGIKNEKIGDDSESIDLLSESGEYVAHLDAEGVHAKDLFIQEAKQGTRKSIAEELAKKLDKDDVPIVNEESQLPEEMIEFQTNNGDLVAGIDDTGVYAKGFYLLNNGKKQPFSLSEEGQRLLAFEPNYISVKNGRLNGGSDNHGTKWYKRFGILHISDTHQFNKEYAEAISIASGRVDIICNTGDDGNGNISQSESLSISDLEKGVDVVRNNNASNLPYLYVKGNHDVCNLKRANYRNIVCNLIDSYSPNVVWGGADVGYGYIDITPNSDIGTIRIIMLDQFDYPDADFPSVRGFMSCTYSQAQITWFINAIKDAASKSIKVITMAHYAFADTTNIWSEEIANADVNGQYQDAFIIADIIDAIQHGTIINKEYTDSKNKENIVVNEDFSSTASLHYICHLFGHIHSKNWYQCKKTDGSKEYDILMIGETSVGRLGTALNKSCREGVNSTACSVLEIDTIEHCVYRVNYGAYMKYDATESKVIEKLNYRF